MEIAALIHFNMATTGSCGEPSAFHPEKLDTDNWVQSIVAFGAHEAVLVAKHACGFCTWPTNATLPVANASRGQRWPNGSRYPYSVAYSPWRGGKGDVVKSFLQSVTQAGLGAGYYYSLGNQLERSLNLSAAQIIAVEQQQLTELWTTYGNNGNLSEVWFDGGIGSGIAPFIGKLLAAHQPQAMGFGACGGSIARHTDTCVTRNAIRGTGTEAGAVGNPNWSFANASGALKFLPSESDTTLQLTDAWFYTEPENAIRSMSELQGVYHDTVGHNSLLMMDFSPTPDGVIAPLHAQRYAEFGAWRRGCYDAGSAGIAGIAEHARGSEHAGPTQYLHFDRPTTIDRVVVREDQTEGEVISAWVVEAQMVADSTPPGVTGAWTRIANGTSMGNKWITLLDTNLTVSAVRSRATATFEGGQARIRSTSAHLCSRSTPSAKCNLRQDWVADGVGNSTNRDGDAKTIAQCCAACSKLKGCALFVATPNSIDGHSCVLWSRTGAGHGKVVKGAVTGSPR